ncbi:MAG: ZIP family metal transporter [Planctomycetota bacterium]
MTYAFIVAGLSLVGAVLPLRVRPGHAPLQVYLSLAAGALLGAAMFHLLPESAEQLHGSFGLPAVAGVMLVFFLQRYVAPHSHEPTDHHVEESAAATPHSGECEHRHDADENQPRSHGHAELRHAPHLGPAAPWLGGWVAILALSIHSFFDGVAVAAAGSPDGAGATRLSLAVFLSVLIHKPMDGLSVSVLLLHAGVGRAWLWVVQLAYAALVPFGAYLYILTRGAFADTSLLAGYTLALSGGIFLSIALTDLLPELHFHKHDRHKLSAALILGLAVMWATSLLGHGGHDDGHSDAHATTPSAVPSNP